MKNIVANETIDIVNKITTRYGRLALTKAAGEAASAQKNGNTKQHIIWKNVINYIRSSINQNKATATT